MACGTQVQSHMLKDEEWPITQNNFMFRLEDRLESLVQYDKQEALRKLSREVNSMQSDIGTMEFGTKLLTMLYYSSQRPLHSHYTPSSIVEDIQDEGQSYIYVLKRTRSPFIFLQQLWCKTAHREL